MVKIAKIHDDIANIQNGVKIPTPGFGTFLTPDGVTCVEAPGIRRSSACLAVSHS